MVGEVLDVHAYFRTMLTETDETVSDHRGLTTWNTLIFLAVCTVEVVGVLTARTEADL